MTGSSARIAIEIAAGTRSRQFDLLVVEANGIETVQFEHTEDITSAPERKGEHRSDTRLLSASLANPGQMSLAESLEVSLQNIGRSVVNASTARTVTAGEL